MLWFLQALEESVVQIFYNVLSSDGTRGDSLSKVSVTLCHFSFFLSSSLPPSQVLTIWQNQEYFSEKVLQEIQLVLTDGPASFLPTTSQSQVSSTAQLFHTLSVSLMCSNLLCNLLLVLLHHGSSSSHLLSLLLHCLLTCPHLLVEYTRPWYRHLKGSPTPGRSHQVTHSPITLLCHCLAK